MDAFQKARAAIDAERARQVKVEGFDVAHDDEHADGELYRAAMIYRDWLTPMAAPIGAAGAPEGWPWEAAWWKPRGRRENLVRAGGLVLAERERIERLPREPGKSPAAHLGPVLEGIVRELALVGRG